VGHVDAAQRFYTLLGILTIVLGGLTFVIIRLFKAGRVYQLSLDSIDHAAKSIDELGDDLRELIRVKEREHDRIDERITQVQGQLQRHEQWHMDAAG
jgi:hypothetical protein